MSRAGRFTAEARVHVAEATGREAMSAISRPATALARPRSRAGCSRGFTLLELVFSVALVAVLAALAISQYARYVDKARSQKAMNEIASLQVEIERFRSRTFTDAPASLAEIGRSGMPDPWGRPYYYTRLSGPESRGAARKDRRLNPLNSDYDLFSAGKDGVFKSQVSQRESLDDIIRARDGAFIGLGSDL